MSEAICGRPDPALDQTERSELIVGATATAEVVKAAVRRNAEARERGARAY
jgi:hypothetical protein